MVYYIPKLMKRWDSVTTTTTGFFGGEKKGGARITGTNSIGFIEMYDSLEALRKDHPCADYIEFETTND